MNRKTLYSLVVICLLIVGAAPALVAFELFDQSQNASGFNEIRPANGMVVQWRVEGERLRVVLDAPTTGWVGIGFHPESGMQGANFVLGYVRRGQTVVADHFGTRRDQHQDDVRLGGTNDVELVSGSESGNRTVIEFTIPLDSGDRYDKVLVPGARTPILLCYGPQDNFTRVHAVEAEAMGDITL